MLRVIEETPNRLVMKDKSPTAGLVAAVFTVLSVGSVLILAQQGIDILIIRNDRDLLLVRLFGFAVFLAVGVGFVLLGIAACCRFLKGVTFILDKTEETMYLQTVNFFAAQIVTQSIYAVSHIHIETDPRMRVYGLYVVLRSGQKLPLAAISTLDEADMQTAVNAIRAFLRA